MDIALINQAVIASIQWQNVVAVLIGVTWGVVVGALPGLGSVLAITMLLPFTFGMEQIPAVSMLLATYAGSVYGGSLSAIMINTPGTPQSAATCLDGYPMAQQGNADLALGWATVASVIGGLLSCCILILAAPQLAAFAVRFGPVETFALIILGLTCVASISQGSIIKGLLAAVIGLFMASVGPDPIVPSYRFTFGIFELSGGLNLIALVVGVFALSEVFSRICQVNKKGGGGIITGKGLRYPKFAEIRKRIWLAIKSALIGSGIGILPGTGAATAAFISYADAKRSSLRRDEMGHGEPDGIVAAEAANNAVTGGALVPSLALGIPGDAVTAVMLATLTIKGITPGVRLMVENPVTVYAAFMALILSNLLLPLTGWCSAKGFSRLLKTPEPLLLTAVTLFCFIGTYTVNGLIFDLWIMFFAGILGFIMRLFQIPVAALVIGLVLGPQLELSLRQGLIVTNNDFASFFSLDHPIALFLFLLTLVMLFLPLIKSYHKHK